MMMKNFGARTCSYCMRHHQCPPGKSTRQLEQGTTFRGLACLSHGPSSVDPWWVLVRYRGNCRALLDLSRPIVSHRPARPALTGRFSAMIGSDWLNVANWTTGLSHLQFCKVA